MMDKIEIMWCQYNAPCWQKNQETHWVHSEPTNNDNNFYNSVLFYPAAS